MGYQNIGPNYWKGEDGRLALIAGTQKLTDRLGRAVQGAGQVGALSRRRLRGADLSRQPEPVHPRPRRDLPGRLLGDRRASTAQAQVQDGRLPAAGGEGRRHLLHLRPCRHRAGHERGKPRTRRRRRRSSNGWPRPSSPTLYANALPGFFSAVEPQGDAEGPAGPGVPDLARQVQVDDPLDLPDPLARHAEPGERDLGRVGQRHQRHRHAGGRGASKLQEGLDKWYKPPTQ